MNLTGSYPIKEMSMVSLGNMCIANVPSLLLMGLVGIFVLLMPVGYAFLLAGAMAFGYVTYGLSHFIIHHTRFRRPLARNWAAHHHIHHYHPDTNFGVTTPLWDILLFTRYVRHFKRI